ncbi:MULTISPECIES: response regulator [Nitratiruptor]|uniref:Putative two-component system response regulator n=1 Tax=Nitratiruptor tergarcus DSM 16512 TaxID=1069081 RepID=A0A1W1WUY9_9BACT|nr:MULTISPECIES: response regulator [Nitratiruptor]BCD62671.1 two-component system, chemotaxis family, chemotaxis protein CheY [Nitratiruptor sp. YY08-13]BCD66607.1 two-component system, chemotaxis family, chemotaxis protein CheY [Nitratiruptor sp. YY08-26]SMC10097.1 putative two-component system response regulator [Nitratiruptor tergarcus DSM 16512]
MKQLKVLYVDDDIINRMLLQNLLKQNSLIYEAIEAKDGKEALQILNKNRDIDFVLLDIYMPQMNGLQMLEYMRKDPRFKDIPVIILSTDESLKTKALELGANDYMIKPVKEKELKEKIEKFGSLT